MLWIPIIAFWALCLPVYGQIIMPPYRVTKDNDRHTTVIIMDGAQYRRIKTDNGSGPLIKVAPQIQIKTGMVEYKNLTGELFVREYYLDGILLGYIEYDGSEMKREIYYNAKGNIYLEARYDKGRLKYVNDKVQPLSPPSPKGKGTGR
jgi:hypothetical protein